MQKIRPDMDIGENIQHPRKKPILLKKRYWTNYSLWVLKFQRALM